MQLVSWTSSKSGLAVGTFSQNTFVLEAWFCHAGFTEGDQRHSPDIAQPAPVGGQVATECYISKTGGGGETGLGWEGRCEGRGQAEHSRPPCDTQGQEVGCVSETHQASRSSLSSCVFSLTSTVNSSYCSFSHLVHLQAGQTCMTAQDFEPDRPKTECELMTLHVVLTSFPVFVTNYVSSVD